MTIRHCLEHMLAEPLAEFHDPFLMGQETWAPPACVDNDADGYGDPASASCAHPELDCDDTNADVNPGDMEASYGDPVCRDGLDNDCDGQTDL